MEINLQQFLLQVVNFAVIFLVLAKFVYRPILKILDERANKINEGLIAAEKSLDSQIRIEETKKKELIKAQKEAALILEEATSKAETMAKDIVDQAKTEAQKAVQNEEKQLMNRLEKEEKRLKGEIAGLVIASTKSLLQTSLTPAIQKEIIKKQINDLKKVKI
ncbi:ATP synthase F0 subunit B [Microgenomates group bacterium RIFCSPLOWO2_01_FULL_47_10]|nr:MAG: ATP synthase F0 subunit B [Microgenomates group bacterium RIFCSPLOWO2_01_FULL_47_10]